MVTRTTYTQDAVRACESVLIIIYCVRNYPGGIPALVQVCRPHLSHGLVREGFGKIRRHFQSVEHIGPRLVADFEAVTDPEARDLIRRAAYEEVRRWLDALEVAPWDGP